MLEFLDYMIWKITERQVVYKLFKMVRSHNIHSLSGHIAAKYGIEKDVFTKTLFSEEFNHYWFSKPFIRFYEALRSDYRDRFHYELEKAIKSCISKDLIEPNTHNGKEYINYTWDGKKLLSIWYFPKIVIESKIFRK